MAYDIEVLPAAARALRKLEPRAAARLSDAIDSLAADPRPQGVKKLEGATDLYRIRVGHYRVIYQIHDRKLLIVIKAGRPSGAQYVGCVPMDIAAALEAMESRHHCRGARDSALHWRHELRP